MVETAQAATTSTDNYELVATVIKVWGLYRTTFIAAFVIFLLATIIFFARKSPWGKWFLLLTILTGASIVSLDGLKQYVAERKKTIVREVLLAPITQTGKLLRGIFRIGR